MTGAARGIGLATTRLLLEQGSRPRRSPRRRKEGVDGPSKAAVITLTEQQAVELGEYGIRANCVAPGPVRTKLAMAVHSQAIIGAYHDAIPLNRYGTEREIAKVIAFLCSDKASYVTGQLLAADGGFGANSIGLPTLRGPR